MFFVHRIYISAQGHYRLSKALNILNVYKQPQSFQDPVLPYRAGSNFRTINYQVADLINIFLPNKNSTFYALDLSGKRFSAFNALSYIYAKRGSPTTIDAGLLRVPTIIESKIKILKRDLLSRTPDVFIISKNISLEPWQTKYFQLFLEWVNSDFIKTNYQLKSSFHLYTRNNQTETFFVYRKIK